MSEATSPQGSVPTGPSPPAEATFGPIALSLSGGGYRAAAFHLGTLFYLDRLGLLRDVTILSTVSGGTLVGMKYALSAHEGIPFDRFYKDFYAFLLNVNLNKRSLQQIGSANRDTLLGYNNLITSFADVYDAQLLGGKRFGIFWESGASHLKDIIFNATEFRTGIACRFQKCRTPSAIIGNGNLAIPPEAGKQIRLADIAAASSCFPGGFEPLAFPNDFDWPENNIPAELQQHVQRPVPLMDGGIYDNQGIDSVILAIDRNEKEIGAFLISDTDVLQEDLFPYPVEAAASGPSLSLLNLFSKILLGLLGFTFAVTVWQHVSEQVSQPVVRLVLYPLLEILTLLAAGALLYVRMKIKKGVLEKIPLVQSDVAWDDLKKLKVSQVIGLIDLRLRSLYALTSRVFMKRVRGFVYKDVFQDERFEKKRISNLIYDLLRTQKRQVAEILKPGDEVTKVAEKAAQAPTTLWFKEESEARNLVACGQFTTCYNILEFICRYHMAGERPQSAQVESIYQKALDDWNRFQHDPTFLV